MQEPGRVPAFPILARGPEWPAQIMVGEVLLVAGHLIGHAEDTVMADEGFELATQIVALDPVLWQRRSG